MASAATTLAATASAATNELDLIMSLPFEMFLEIVKRFDIDDLWNAQKVCKLWEIRFDDRDLLNHMPCMQVRRTTWSEGRIVSFGTNIRWIAVDHNGMRVWQKRIGQKWVVHSICDAPSQYYANGHSMVGHRDGDRIRSIYIEPDPAEHSSNQFVRRFQDGAWVLVRK